MQIIDLTSRRWKEDLTPAWGVTAGISNSIRQLELGHVELLPNLHLGPTLLVASDYSGQHKKTSHEAFSFLIIDLAFCWLWDEMRREVRRTLLREHLRMSYKSLNDVQRRRALVPFLNAADWLPGVLATVLVDKRLIESLRLTSEDRLRLPKHLANWPIHVVRRLLFVAHLGALFIAGLSAPGQNVLWFTDNDDFVANDERVTNLTPLFAGLVSSYSSSDMGHFRFGTTKCDNGDLMIEDLTSLPDLAAGATCEIAMSGILPQSSGLLVSVCDKLPSKAASILAWLGEPGRALRRLVFAVDNGNNRQNIMVRALTLSNR